MRRSEFDMFQEDGEVSCPCIFEDSSRRKSCDGKSNGHRRLYRQNFMPSETCPRCEQLTYELEPTMENRRRNRRAKLQHCPSCHCPFESTKVSSSRIRNSENVEASLEQFEQIYKGPTTTAVKKSHSSPLSPRPAARCRKAHCTNKPSINCNRQRRRSGQENRFSDIVEEIVNYGLANEYVEISDKFVHQVPIKSSTKKDNLHWNNYDNASTRDAQEYFDVDIDSLEQYCMDHPQSKKPPSSNILPQQTVGHPEEKIDVETITKSRNKTKKRNNRNNDNDDDNAENESEEESCCRQFQQELRETWRKLNAEAVAREYAKWKQSEQQVNDVEDVDGSNDRKTTEIMDDEERIKKNFTSRLPIPRSTGSPNRLQSIIVRDKNLDEQKKGKPMARIEASNSDHCVTFDDVDVKDNSATLDIDDTLKQEELRRQVHSIPYCRPSQRPNAKKAIARNDKSCVDVTAKKGGEQKASDPRVSRKTTNDKMGNVELSGKHLYACGDLDLHASKSHIVELIDRALSKEFGNSPDEKKDDITKIEPIQQELCIEISKALQGDCCHTLAQTLLGHRGTSDYVKQLKMLRWEYLNHIQEKVKKLYDLEKILDDCSPTRSSSSTKTHVVANATDERGQLSHHQQRQQEEQQRRTITTVS